MSSDHTCGVAGRPIPDACLRPARTAETLRMLLPGRIVRWLTHSLKVSCAVAVTACGDAATGPKERVSFTISDAVHSGGKRGFYFLPPLVRQPNVTGTADATLHPRVVVCEWTGNACSTVVADFSPTSGSGAHTPRYESGSESYLVNWDTKTCVTGPCTLDPSRYYRIRVLVGDLELGYADVDVVSNGGELRNIATDQYIGLLNGRTLPVRFRIERGIAASIVVTPPGASLRIGESQQFSASIFDLHGEALTLAPEWHSTSDAVGVDASGLATAVSAGVAEIVASYENLAARASVEVFAPVEYVTLHPEVATLIPGQSLQFVATSYAADHSVLPGRQVEFSSSDEGVATVDASGFVTAVAIGTAEIVATSEGRSAVATVTVGAAGFTLKAHSLALGDLHTCGLDESDEAWCWGLNDGGQLGVGSVFARSMRPMKVAGSHKFALIGAGSALTCGLKVDGSVWCWGRGHVGQLGHGAFVAVSALPVRVATDLIFTKLFVGGASPCALTADGTPYCWGWNDSNRLGVDGPNRSTPVPVGGGHRFSEMSVGVNSTCAIKLDATVWCWGNSAAGPSHTGPLIVANGSLRLASVSVGLDHACGIGTDAQTYCWGNNTSGQLGDGSGRSTTYLSPVVSARGFSFVEVFASSTSSCGRTATDETWCWGAGPYGQLGNGATGQSSVPSLVATPVALASFEASRWYHACGIAAGGNVYCWGYNGFGGLGDGTTVNRSVPVQVVEP